MTKHEMITRKFIDLSRPWGGERTSEVGKGGKKGASALTWGTSRKQYCVSILGASGKKVPENPMGDVNMKVWIMTITAVIGLSMLSSVAWHKVRMSSA